MRIIALLVGLGGFGFGSNAMAFNDLSCSSQAKILAEAIVMTQVGNSYSHYEVVKDSESRDGNYQVTIIYHASVPSNNDSAAFQIEFTFSDFSGGVNTEDRTQKECYIDDIKIQMAG